MQKNTIKKFNEINNKIYSLLDFPDVPSSTQNRTMADDINKIANTETSTFDELQDYAYKIISWIEKQEANKKSARENRIRLEQEKENKRIAKERAELEEKRQIELQKKKENELAEFAAIARHIFNVVTFPSIATGFFLGSLLPILSCIIIFIIIGMPFLYKYILSNIYMETLYKISLMTPIKIRESALFNYVFNTKILHALSLEWAKRQDLMSNLPLTIYLYITLLIGIIPGLIVVSSIFGIFSSIISLFS